MNDANQSESRPAPDPALTTDFAQVRSEKRRLLAELQTKGSTIATPDNALARWPCDPKSDPDVASLLFADYCRRQEQGETPSIAEYQRRFPEHRDSLADILRHHSVLRSIGGVSGSGETLRLPVVGEELFGFRLFRELGRGAFARVFLAGQAELAGRPVVLKVSAIDGEEPQTLAQLQHTNIVPIYSVHEDAAAGLRAVCMPYFGRTSLSAVLKALWGEDRPSPSHGKEFVHALDEAVAGEQADEGNASPGQNNPQERGVLPHLEQMSYIQAVAWLGVRLAEGLHHAHGRGILHRDIKPSNILIAGDGQPLLLDFNLAQNTRNAQAHATLGGTVAYMAPEHLRALAACDPALTRQVGRPADLYSLGMVLFEMLTGHGPFQQSASYSPLPLLIEAMAVERGKTVPSVRAQRPDVPWGLESIVRKCLAPSPADRYQQAEHLAEDLTRFLSDRPLRYAPELSWVERVEKWGRRHPRLTSASSVATAAVVLLALLGLGLAGAREHLAHTQEQLAVARAKEREKEYTAGTERALCLVNTTSDLQDHLRLGRTVCEETLALYGVLDRDDWQEDPSWMRLSPEDRRRLAEDTRELLLLLAWARVRTSPEERAVLHDALALLERAEAVEGLAPSPALWRDRALYLSRLGDREGAKRAEEQATQIPARSPRDHYLLATALIRDLAASAPAEQTRGDVYTRALEHLNEAIRLNPRHYWSHVQRGICRLDLGQNALAAGDFGVCIGLWPEFAWGYFNRGVSLTRLGRREEALADYTAALDRDPDFLPAWMNRGLIHLELQQYARALADFDEAGRLGHDGAALHAGRGGALEGLKRHAEADTAFRLALGRIPVSSARFAEVEERVNLLLQYGFTVARRLPREARQAFEEVRRLRPDHPRALYGEGMLLTEQGEAQEALGCFSRAIQADPQFVEARRFRAVLLARGKEFEAASQDINWCLEREPDSGATLYAAACVTALMAEKTRDPKARKDAAGQALALLQLAFAHGYGRDRAAADADLAGIRDTPEFQKLLAP